MTKVVTTTSTYRDEPAAPAALVAQHLAQGWVVQEESPEATFLTHPGLTGVRLAVLAR